MVYSIKVKMNNEDDDIDREPNISTNASEVCGDKTHRWEGTLKGETSKSKLFRIGYYYYKSRKLL